MYFSDIILILIIDGSNISMYYRKTMEISDQLIDSKYKVVSFYIFTFLLLCFNFIES